MRSDTQRVHSEGVCDKFRCHTHTRANRWLRVDASGCHSPPNRPRPTDPTRYRSAGRSPSDSRTPAEASVSRLSAGYKYRLTALQIHQIRAARPSSHTRSCPILKVQAFLYSCRAFSALTPDPLYTSVLVVLPGVPGFFSV